jgi:tetratricopeptide (TPR) repeat protein
VDDVAGDLRRDGRVRPQLAAARIACAGAAIPGKNTAAALQSRLDAGDIGGALADCRARIASHPQDADAHRHLGQLLAAQGQFLPAYRSAHRACELAPHDARSWSDLGRVFALERKYADAARCFAESVAIDDRHADGWHNLGMALHKAGNSQGAFDAFKRALQVDPERAQSYLGLGNLLVEGGQFDDAVECFERAARLDPGLAQARSKLARQLSTRGQVKRAESLFRQSLGLDPEHTQGWLGLGRTLEDLGEAEGALSCYRNVLARQPHNAFAMGQYLALVKDEPDTAVLATATDALDNPAASDEGKALIGYGLLKFHDRRKNYAAAAEAGTKANAARRRGSGALDQAALQRRVDEMIATYDRDFFASRRRFGLSTDQPVFIVGLPRSGTTLTEQILAAHPAMHGAGELPDLALIAARSVADDQLPWRAAASLDEAASRERASDYLAALRAGAPRQRLRISDKSPLNFFQVAFAAVLFPQARVIHCHRGPRDNALSIWMENFNPDQRYATDFDDLAFFRGQYLRLMAHWREHLPLPILELGYEETVADLETQARRLTGFLGVEWDARCLDFHQSERAVQTPSRWQVRQPVYRSSMQRWKRYESLLPELMQAFGADD